MKALYSLFLLVPAGFALFACWDHRKEKKGILAILLVVLLSNLLAYGAKACLFQGPTSYEYLLVASVTAAVLSMCAVPRFLGASADRFRLLKALGVAAAIVAIYSALTYGQTAISSDVATPVLLSQSQLEHHTWFPQTWNYVNGELWVLCNHTFIFPFVALMHDMSLARTMGSAALVLALAVTLVWQSKTLFHSDAWVISFPLTFVFLTYGSSLEILYEASYTSLLIWPLVCSALLCTLWQGRASRARTALLAVLMVLLCMGGVRFIADMALPLLLTCLFLLYMELREWDTVDWKHLRRRLACIAVLVLSSALGVGIYLWLCAGLTMNNTGNNAMQFVSSLKAMYDTLVQAFLSLFGCFGYSGSVNAGSMPGLRNLASIGIAALVVFIIPVCQGFALKKETEEIKFFFWFVTFHNLVIMMAAVFFSLAGQRYLLTSAFLSLVLSSRYIYAHWIAEKPVRGILWSGLFAGVTIFECVALVQNSTGWRNALYEKEAFAQELCDRGLTKGYATFWNAYNNEVYSDRRIEFCAVNFIGNLLAPHQWLVDDERFDRQDGGSFLLLTESEKDDFEANYAWAFGEPAQSFALNNMFVFVYDYDITARMRNGLLDNCVTAYELICGENASLEEGHLVLESGGNSYGPFSTIKPGRYLVTYVGENLDLGYYDIFSSGTPDALQYEPISQSGEALQAELTVNERVDDLEFSLHNDAGGEQIILDHVEVEPLDS